MPKVISSSSGTAKFIRSATLSNFNFTATAVPRNRIVSGTATTNTTTKDVVTSNITSSISENEFDISLTVPLTQISTISNLTPSIINFNNLSATRVSNGTASVLFYASTCARRVDFAVSQVGGGTTTQFSSFASGSLGAHLLSSISTLLSGKTAPTYTVSGAVGSQSVSATSTISDIFVSGARNSSGWWGTTDLTCIPYFQLQNGVLVSPRDVLFANHFGYVQHPTFIDNSGNTYTRTVVAVARVGSTDVLAATLDSDLPAGVTPAKVLPANWRTYLPQPTYGYPCIFTNQDRRLILGDSSSSEIIGSEFSIGQSFDAVRNPWFYAVRSNDSGSPAFMIINGSLVVLLDWHYAGASGPNYADNITAINSQLTTNGSPYSLTTVNLSSFNTY